MTIDQIREGLMGIAAELDEADAHLLNVTAAVLSALEAEHIDCYAEPTE